jgi:hypothetical protein
MKTGALGTVGRTRTAVGAWRSDMARAAPLASSPIPDSLKPGGIDSENHPWKIRLVEHPERFESSFFRAAKKAAHKILDEISDTDLPYGSRPVGSEHWEMHHGGNLSPLRSPESRSSPRRLPRSVHLRGDSFRRMIVSGREEFTPQPTAEGRAQLRLRYQASVAVADLYAQAGWTVVVQDVVLGEHLDAYLDAVTAKPLYRVVLAPRPEAVATREAGRHKNGYGGPWTVDILDDELRRDTPRRGLWLDMSNQTPHQTVDQRRPRHGSHRRLREPIRRSLRKPQRPL